MRKSLLLLLLATAAAPAFAAVDAEDRAARREVEQEERAERAASRAEKRADRPQRSERQFEARTIERSADRDGAAPRQHRRRAISQSALEYSVRNLGDNTEPTAEQRRIAADSVRNWRRAERQNNGDFEQRRRQLRERIERRAPTEGEDSSEQKGQLVERRADRTRLPPVISRIPREGTQPPLSVNASRRTGTRHWNTNWRHDRRYDWHNWRRRNRSIFRLGFYYDPFGWSYRPYSIGWRLWPSYYSRSYWLNDPWMYRLPPAYAGTRWIRYHNDALLVDTWTGEVVDVIYNFFW